MARHVTDDVKTLIFCEGPWDGASVSVGSAPTEIVLDFWQAENCPRFIRDERQPGIRLWSVGSVPAKYLFDGERDGEYRYRFMPEQRSEPVDIWGFTRREREEIWGPDEDD